MYYAIVLSGGAHPGKRPGTRLARINRITPDGRCRANTASLTRLDDPWWTKTERTFDRRDIVRFFERLPTRAEVKAAQASLMANPTREAHLAAIRAELSA
jgi:hypothetical protein